MGGTNWESIQHKWVVLSWVNRWNKRYL